MLNHRRTAFDLPDLLCPGHFSRRVLVVAMLAMAPTASGVEVLSVHELASHCERLEDEPDGADSQYCVRYIQGFIDGAVVTDVRVMLNTESDPQEGESFSERAKRTRVPSRMDQLRAAQLAGFCLGDPLPLRDVVNLVVTDLAKLDIDGIAESPARDAVYRSLQDHYPCPGE